jgi:hypothetical protein
MDGGPRHRREPSYGQGNPDRFSITRRAVDEQGADLLAVELKRADSGKHDEVFLSCYCAAVTGDLPELLLANDESSGSLIDLGDHHPQSVLGQSDIAVIRHVDSDMRRSRMVGEGKIVNRQADDLHLASTGLAVGDLDGGSGSSRWDATNFAGGHWVVPLQKVAKCAHGLQSRPCSRFLLSLVGSAAVAPPRATAAGPCLLEKVCCGRFHRRRRRLRRRLRGLRAMVDVVMARTCRSVDSRVLAMVAASSREAAIWLACSV